MRLVYLILAAVVSSGLVSARRAGSDPEPGDRALLDARLKTRSKRRSHGSKGKRPESDLDVHRVLFSRDVSRSNPFEDVYRAPGGPNDGPGRAIGAPVPPRDVTSPAPGKGGCDPLIDAACVGKLGAMGNRRVNADPDDIKHAPRAMTVRVPRKWIKNHPGDGDPYGDSTAAAIKARQDMFRWRRSPGDVRARGYDPSKSRNMLPYDATGPTRGADAMHDPMPQIPDQGVPTGARWTHDPAPISARVLGLDPYARAAQALHGVEDGDSFAGDPPAQEDIHSAGGGDQSTARPFTTSDNDNDNGDGDASSFASIGGGVSVGRRNKGSSSFNPGTLASRTEKKFKRAIRRARGRKGKNNANGKAGSRSRRSKLAPAPTRAEGGSARGRRGPAMGGPPMRGHTGTGHDQRERAFKDMLHTSDPDSGRIGQPRPDSTDRDGGPPVSNVAPMSDPIPNPREMGKVAEAAYVKYPRFNDGFTTTGPMSAEPAGVSPPDAASIYSSGTGGNSGANAPAVSDASAASVPPPPMGPAGSMHISAEDAMDRPAFKHEFWAGGLLPTTPQQVDAALQQAREEARRRATDVGETDGERGFETAPAAAGI